MAIAEESCTTVTQLGPLKWRNDCKVFEAQSVGNWSTGKYPSTNGTNHSKLTKKETAMNTEKNISVHRMMRAAIFNDDFHMFPDMHHLDVQKEARFGTQNVHVHAHI